MSTRELSKFDTKPLRHPYELRISSSIETPLLQSEYYIDKEPQEGPEERQHCAEPECSSQCVPVDDLRLIMVLYSSQNAGQ